MIVVYTQPACRPCKRVIAKLAEAEVDFKVVDISQDQDAWNYVVNSLGGKSTPVIEVPGWEPVLGYQPDKVKEICSEFGV